MIADQNFYDIFLTFFYPTALARPTAEGRSLSGPNIRLRPKVKIAPTVQHWLFHRYLLLIWKKNGKLNREGYKNIFTTPVDHQNKHK